MSTYSKNADKKLQKKQKRCQQIISADTQIQCGDQPTENLVICNAGLSTGLQMDQLLDEIHRHDASVLDVIMVPGKSYCFARCSDIDESRRVYERLHGRSRLGQNDGVLYLSYCSDVPSVENSHNRPHPPGLLLLEDFITEDEEAELFECVTKAGELSGEENANTLKHRIVKHFGYEFLYGTNNVDVSKPLELKIPNECDVLWPRLRARVPALDSPTSHPDQLTINVYQPGQGIPPHVDTHSAFLDPICSLSLASDVTMEFRQPTTGAHVSVALPRRSMLVISGESRYGWTHGITPRKFDIVNTKHGLSVAKRNLRLSFTFRWLQSTPCHCLFPGLCDTAQKAEETRKSSLVDNPAQLEHDNVHRVYDEIATHFSETRHSPWPHVEGFVRSLGAGAVLADIGCGNGKYLMAEDDGLCKLGGDRSAGLLNVCRERGLNVFQCDCLQVPLRGGSVDGCISIAVIHHLASEDRRLQAVREMARILRIGGKALIYVWAKNQAKDSRQSSYLRQNKRNANLENVEIVPESEETQKFVEGLPVHTNRTQFAHQDMLVPWKLKGGAETNGADPVASVEFLRFYHVFEEHELEELVGQVKGVQVERSYYDQGNWCVVFKKVESS